MNQIKFSHRYRKLFGPQEGPPKTAWLLEVISVQVDDLSKPFIEYDTEYFDENGMPENFYKLPKGKALVLIFVATTYESIFTTIRSAHTYPGLTDKETYYRSLIGKEFEVVITEKK